jgi:hypothetical protein
MVKIRLKNRNDNDRISSYLKNNWGGNFIISKGICHSCEELQGLSQKVIIQLMECAYIQ